MTLIMLTQLKNTRWKWKIRTSGSLTACSGKTTFGKAFSARKAAKRWIEVNNVRGPCDEIQERPHKPAPKLPAEEVVCRQTPRPSHPQLWPVED